MQNKPILKSIWALLLTYKIYLTSEKKVRDSIRIFISILIYFLIAFQRILWGFIAKTNILVQRILFGLSNLTERNWINFTYKLSHFFFTKIVANKFNLNLNNGQFYVNKAVSYLSLLIIILSTHNDFVSITIS